MPSRPLYHVDAFTSQPFAGNPAGVVLDADGLDERTMLLIARELKHSETAFVLSPKQGGTYRVRFFTPTQEVNLCGHATVATAWVLHRECKAAAALKQETKVGVLDLRVEKNTVWMTQAPPTVEPLDVATGEIAEVLGLMPADIAVSAGPIQRAYTGNRHLIVPVWTREAIDAAEPDLRVLANLNVCLRCETTHLFCAKDLTTSDTIYTRDFAPAVGIAEDPVTGSANGALGGYFALNQLLKRDESCSAPAEALRRIEFVVEQGAAIDRPGRVIVRATTSKVEIGGEAVIVSQGTLDA
jgi:PhzF family phenazine biosynthesis protein